MKQLSEEWHQARAGKVTGSRVGAILNHNPYSQPVDVLREMVRQKLGSETEFKGNIATEWGTKHESVASDWYENTYGLFIEEYGIVNHAKYPFLAYSPDGTVESNGVVQLIEIKCPFTQKIPAKIPDHYMDQVQLGMEVMNLDSCIFIYWTPLNIRVLDVPRDMGWLDRNMPLIKEFYDTYLFALTEPDTYLEDLIFRRSDLEFKEQTARWVRAKQRFDTAKASVDIERKALVELAAGKTSEGFGVRVTQVTKKGNPLHSAYFKKHPEALHEVEFGPTTTTARVSIIKEK